MKGVAVRSSSPSSQLIIDLYAGGSGLREPAGGIIPARSFRTTRSQVSAFSWTFAVSI